MTISGRIARHLRAHVVGYLALFVALSGTAVALPGKNKVDANDLRAGAVKPKAIKKGAVTTAKLRDRAVTSTKIADGSVIGLDLGDASVTQPKLAEDSVSRGKIQTDSINAARLANSSVNSGKVDNGTLQGQDFAPGQLSAGFVAESVSALFTLPRAGRLYVNVNFVPTCATADCDYSVTIDGVPVPGTEFTSAADDTQLVATGVSAPLAAGDHTVAIQGGDTYDEPTITAILLQ